MSMTKKHPPTGLLLWLLRAPAWLYRNGLGWLLGKRFMMFTHVGRKTGRKFDTVVEVVHHDSETDRYYIASGWGEKAHWLKNISKTPQIDVITGRRKFMARAIRLDFDTGTQALLAYAEKYPTAFRKLSKAITGQEIAPGLDGAKKLGLSVPVIAVDPIIEVSN